MDLESVTLAEAAVALGVASNTSTGWYRSGALTAAAPAPGGAVRVRLSSVIRLRDQRRTDALVRHPDTAAFAAACRARVLPEVPEVVTLIDGRTVQRPWLVADDGRYVAPNPGGAQALGADAADATAIFGAPALKSASQPGSACRWCWPRLSARVNHTVAPVDSTAFRALLGGPPCAACRSSWAAETDAAVARQRRQAADLGRRAHQQSTQRVAAAKAALAAENARATQVRAAANGLLAAAAPPGWHTPAAYSSANNLAARVLAAVDRVGAVSPRGVRDALGLAPGLAKAALDGLVRRGTLARRADGLYCRARAVPSARRPAAPPAPPRPVYDAAAVQLREIRMAAAKQRSKTRLDWEA